MQISLSLLLNNMNVSCVRESRKKGSRDLVMIFKEEEEKKDYDDDDVNRLKSLRAADFTSFFFFLGETRAIFQSGGKS